MDRDDQVRFRNAAAGLIKSLIRARARQEPEFRSRISLHRWMIPEAESETLSCAQLLNRVRQFRDRFERKFLADQDSIPAPRFAQEAEVFDCLVDRVAAFICGDLEEAIRAAAQDKLIHWEELAAWQDLVWLRDSLDKLPGSNKTHEEQKKIGAQGEKVLLYGLRDKPVVKGRKKNPLGSKQYELIERLIKAGEQGCSKPQLEKITPNYWKSLKGLKDSDPDWDEVIHFPGKPHGGYWID